MGQAVLLLTNDDGVEAPGLAALRAAADGLGDCRVMAPAGPRSGCGHAVTTHAPLILRDHAPGQVAVEGTPADCVRMALHRFGPGIAWVLSGINAGGNLGADTHHSGTVAAVREAALRGIPGIAISHYIARGRAVDWDLAARRAGSVLRSLMARPPAPGTFWNVNLPHPEPGGPEPDVVFCPVDPSPLPLAYRDEAGGLRYCGNYQERARQAAGDVATCFGGRVSVSMVPVMASVWPIDGPD